MSKPLQLRLVQEVEEAGHVWAAEGSLVEGSPVVDTLVAGGVEVDRIADESVVDNVVGGFAEGSPAVDRLVVDKLVDMPVEDSPEEDSWVVASQRLVVEPAFENSVGQDIVDQHLCNNMINQMIRPSLDRR